MPGTVPLGIPVHRHALHGGLLAKPAPETLFRLPVLNINALRNADRPGAETALLVFMLSERPHGYVSSCVKESAAFLLEQIPRVPVSWHPRCHRAPANGDVVISSTVSVTHGAISLHGAARRSGFHQFSRREHGRFAAVRLYADTNPDTVVLSVSMTRRSVGFILHRSLRRACGYLSTSNFTAFRVSVKLMRLPDLKY